MRKGGGNFLNTVTILHKVHGGARARKARNVMRKLPILGHTMIIFKFNVSINGNPFAVVSVWVCFFFLFSLSMLLFRQIDFEPVVLGKLIMCAAHQEENVGKIVRIGFKSHPGVG